MKATPLKRVLFSGTFPGKSSNVRHCFGPSRGRLWPSCGQSLISGAQKRRQLFSRLFWGCRPHGRYSGGRDAFRSRAVGPANRETVGPHVRPALKGPSVHNTRSGNIRRNERCNVFGARNRRVSENRDANVWAERRRGINRFLHSLVSRFPTHTSRRVHVYARINSVHRADIVHPSPRRPSRVSTRPYASCRAVTDTCVARDGPVRSAEAPNHG